MTIGAGAPTSTVGAGAAVVSSNPRSLGGALAVVEVGCSVVVVGAAVVVVAGGCSVVEVVDAGGCSVVVVVGAAVVVVAGGCSVVVVVGAVVVVPVSSQSQSQSRSRSRSFLVVVVSCSGVRRVKVRDIRVAPWCGLVSFGLGVTPRPEATRELSGVERRT